MRVKLVVIQQVSYSQSSYLQYK